ncbi:g3796 [Coccomyxa viridis]|uniref:DNA-directed RNA polymerase III subunit n=1 Tax=Coccomyxa viridis TaxID=1274662 RepID=A0ABP1FTT1_9CHLO
MAWRGRGRGRGGPPPHSSTNGADTEPEGPPPLFPEVPQPEVPPATAEDQILLQHWRSLTNAFRTSCYRIDPKAEKRKVVDDPYATSKDAGGASQKLPLTSILTLDAKYFPEELFSGAEKRAAARASTLRLPDQKKPSGEADIFERFAALEKSGARAEEGAGAERRAGGAPASREGQPGQDNEDGEEELGEEEDEEEGFNDEMDLVMNENYDDDEGYMDDDDGGDGEGIF